MRSSYFDRGVHRQIRNRLEEAERQLDQVVPREAAVVTVLTGAFPANPYVNQLVYRSDLIPAGWYQWNGLTWVVV